jgi:predicted O-methyltransferase YrrM
MILNYIMNITEYLHVHGYYYFEGYSQQIPNQVEDLIELTKTPHINVMEIGFNAGHSADIFLKNNATLRLTSFDLGTNEYVLTGKKYIDEMYPNRHTLILGDSTITVPQYNGNFDVIFIDGGHEYDVAKKDIENCMRFAHKDTIVMVDDTIYTEGWEASYTIGPTKAWTECVDIIELNRKEYCVGRGMSCGRYKN